MAKIKKIALSNLQVNTENYRFEPVSGQKEAIDVMVKDQKEKLFLLVSDILLNGFNPSDPIQVVASSHDKNKYNVIEGNRRTVSLKLLYNPDLIDETGLSSLKKKFRNLHEKNKTNLITSVDCIVYNTPEEADKWIKLKHAGQLDGIGTVAWTAQQIDRFEEKIGGKSSIVLQTIKLLEKSIDTPNELKQDLKNIKTSNLERLISDPKVRDYLGIDINNGIIQSEIDQKEVIKGLVYIAKDLLDPQFKVNRIYTKEDREDYLKKIPKSNQPVKTNKAGKPWQFTGGTPKPMPAPLPKPKPIPKDRDILIPKTCLLKISNAKVNTLYHELQRLSVTNFTNVCAIAFRSFVEFSMDCYIEDNGLKVGRDGKTAIDKNSSFRIKIIEVANNLEDKKLADPHLCKGIRSAVNNKDDLLGIDTLHSYVHNATFSAIPKNIIITWDNIQTFMEKVWGNIK